MRYIHIFVSSTFSDMHRERDLLHQVAGLINRDIYSQGYQIILRDLRYGIDTANMDDEKAIEKKVLSECFEAINQCQLFVLLLGNRYGSVFEDLSVPQLYLPNHELEGKSVTHLEVDYGMLKIDQKHIIAFERKFAGDLSVLPPQYRENETGAAKKQNLVDSLLHRGCYHFDTYSAGLENGRFVIDEYYFLKHGRGLIEQMVSDYIRQQQEHSTDENTSAIESICYETLSEVLIQEIDKKVAIFPDNYKQTARDLMLLRIQNFLHQQDYDRINRLGASGNVIQEYRRTLIANLPDDFIRLLQEICGCISSVVDPTLDVFNLLQIVASASKTALSQIGGISLREIMKLANHEELPVGLTCMKWMVFRNEIGGLNYNQHVLAQRALACFLEKGVLLTASPTGYSFVDKHIAAVLCGLTPQYEEIIWTYTAVNFWYLPDPVRAWIAMLETDRYDLGLTCLQTIQLDKRFDERLHSFVETNHAAGGTIIPLKKFANWMIEQSVEEVYILYILQLCCWIVNSGEELLADQQYQQWIVPFYQEIYNRYYEKHRNELTAAGLFLLWYIDNEVVLAPSALHPSSRLAGQMENADDLADAVFGLFMCHDLSQPEGLKEYLRMVRILIPYLSGLDSFIQLLRMATVRGWSYRDCLCKNLILMVFGNEVLKKEALIRILDAVMCIRCEEGTALTAIVATNQHLVEYAYNLEDDDFCISALHILHDIVSFETRMRRTEWCCWSAIISSDIINGLYRHYDDAVVREIACIQDELNYVEFEELAEKDEASLREVEEMYMYFHNTGTSSSY